MYKRDAVYFFHKCANTLLGENAHRLIPLAQQSCWAALRKYERVPVAQLEKHA